MPSPEIKHFQDSDKPESTQSGPNLELAPDHAHALDTVAEAIVSSLSKNEMIKLKKENPSLHFRRI